jgi:cytoskeletal protein RodZ
MQYRGPSREVAALDPQDVDNASTNRGMSVAFRAMGRRDHICGAPVSTESGAMSDLGHDLRLARERAGMSLQGLSARTKIREPLLEAMEHDEFARLPAGLLTRGYLRAYAKEVGLEPEAVVQRYKTEFEPPPPAAAPPSLRTDEEIQIIARRIQAGLGIIILIAVVAFITLMSRGSNSEVARVESTGGSAVMPPPPTVESKYITPSDSSRLTVRIDPTDVVWVQATADGRRVLSSLIHPDQPQVIEANDRLVLRVGDAGAFHYTVDGVRGRPLGISGQVREVRITRDNRSDFQAP